MFRHTEPCHNKELQNKTDSVAQHWHRCGITTRSAKRIKIPVGVVLFSFPSTFCSPFSSTAKATGISMFLFWDKHSQ